MKDPACLHKPYIRTILPWDTDKAWRTTHSSRSGISQSVSLTAKDFCSSLTESYSDWWTWPCTFSLWCLCSCCMWFPLRANLSIMPRTCTHYHKHTPYFATVTARSSAHLRYYTQTFTSYFTSFWTALKYVSVDNGVSILALVL